MKAFGTKLYVVQEKLKQQGKILLANDSQESKKEAKVLSVGKDVSDNVKVEDKVVFDISAGSIYKEDEDGTYLFIDESDILGVVDE